MTIVNPLVNPCFRAKTRDKFNIRDGYRINPEFLYYIMNGSNYINSKQTCNLDNPNNWTLVGKKNKQKSLKFHQQKSIKSITSTNFFFKFHSCSIFLSNITTLFKINCI